MFVNFDFSFWCLVMGFCCQENVRWFLGVGDDCQGGCYFEVGECCFLFFVIGGVVGVSVGLFVGFVGQEIEVYRFF